MDLIGEGHQQTPALPIDTIPGHLFRRLSVICNLLFRKFITVTNMHIFPIHEQYIKDSSVLLAFYDSSMVKYRKVSSVSFSKMKVNIVIFIAAVDLFPDACFYLLLLIFADQIVEPFSSKSE